MMSDQASNKSASDTESVDDFDRLKAEREARKYRHATEKGRRMAKSIAEYVLLRFFFRDIKDKKKIALAKSLFQNDMQFNLSTGEIE